jgi:UDP-galactopyranose mutase
MRFDIIIAGAGPVGCIIAQKCAAILKWKVLILDKRDHIAGNCKDEYKYGVLVHAYGPHYFRTSNDDLLEYLSQFTEWIPGKYFVKSKVGNKLYPFPINLDTLEMFFKKNFDSESAQAFLDTKRIRNANPQNSEQFVLSKVGTELYKSFYLGYTLKQWGMHPKDLSPSVCGRIPIRFNRDSRYVDSTHQLIPKDGYTEMYRKMIAHENITLMLEADYFEARKEHESKYATVYTGPIDTYFEYSLGKLPWRSLEFEFKEYKQEYKQECVQINYPNETPYTRSVEAKHITGQKSDNTVICNETPVDKGDPYYPMPHKSSQDLYLDYEKLAKEETLNKHVYFAGRLATYKYINMDQAMESAFEMFDRIKSRHFDK